METQGPQGTALVAEGTGHSKVEQIKAGGEM